MRTHHRPRPEDRTWLRVLALTLVQLAETERTLAQLSRDRTVRRAEMLPGEAYRARGRRA